MTVDFNLENMPWHQPLPDWLAEAKPSEKKPEPQPVKAAEKPKKEEPKMTATWTKLRTGDFGIRVLGAKPEKGTVINVTSKAGKTSTVSVQEIVWSGADKDTGSPVHLCAISSDGPRRASRFGGYRRSARRNWKPCGYPGCSPSFCDDCGGEGM